jgi:hypothetical protein
MFAIPAGGRIGIADISTGTIAGPAGAVIPAARVLRHVAADGPLVPNLRRRGQFGTLREKAVLLFG